MGISGRVSGDVFDAGDELDKALEAHTKASVGDGAELAQL